MAKNNDGIVALRAEGLSYREIASRLGLPLGTVKSACSRHALARSVDVCRDCGKPLTHCPGKKRKVFCCDACRWRWHRHNAKGHGDGE